MSELRVQGLTKRVHNQVIVDHVDFQVNDDEFFVLLGPSEGGKTTILRMICGFEQPDSGFIFLDGRDITTLAARSRNVSVVFQEHAILPHLNVFENIAFGMRFQNVPKEKIPAQVETVAEMLGLKDLLTRSCQNLSGGEQQRVAIARAMLRNAAIYLFDEPISQLDTATRRRTRQDIMMVHQIRRKPCIYITQDHVEAFTMANRVALVAYGKIHQIGTPDELRHAPANLFVAKFLSDPPLNVFEGTMHYSGMHYQLHAADLRFTFPLHWTRQLSLMGPESKVILGMRPSAIVPEWAFDTLGNLPYVVINVQVTHVGPIMGKRLIFFRTEHGLELQAEFKDTANYNLNVGQIMRVAINPEHIFFFHPHTQELLNPGTGVTSSSPSYTI